MKTMCGGLFSFCFLHETVFGNGQVAITHNVISLGEVADFGKIKLQLKNKYDAKRERE